MKKYTENDLKNDVLTWLWLHNLFAWRENVSPIPTGKIINGQMIFRKIQKWEKRGKPDIMCILPNKMFWGIETKSEGEKQSEEQKRFQQECPGFYVVAWSIKDVEDYFFKHIKGLI